MPNKTEEYLALACKTADSFSRQWEHWAEFLITAARLYKYSYPDQLMIYAQRPDATACAEYDVWNNKMNRYVRRGSKGIALLDESGGYPRLHYVFDVSDTAPRRNALYPDLWQINESLKEPVRSMLAENYGVHSESFGQQLADVAGKLVQSYGWLSIMCKRSMRSGFRDSDGRHHRGAAKCQHTAGVWHGTGRSQSRWCAGAVFALPCRAG